MYKQVISLLALAVLTAGCGMGTYSHGRAFVAGSFDPSAAISAAAEAEHEEHERERVRLVEAPQARSAMRSQDRASLARYEVLTTLRHCFESGTCSIPPQELPGVIIAVSRGLAVDEAITVSASQSDGYGYGYGDGDGFWQAQAAQMGGGRYPVPADLMAQSPEILQRLDRVEQRTEAVVRVQRDTSEELAGHLDRNRRSRRER